MKHGKPIGEAYENCFNSTEGIVDGNGVVNWGIAMRADPGVTQCPKCKEYLWKEAPKLECDCGCCFDTVTGLEIQRLRTSESDKPTGGGE